MKLSTRGRYGLRMLVDLSQQGAQVVTLKSIAVRQELSVNYLEQVAKDLKRSGYIRSQKGPQGGYLLALEPKDIVIGDVLRILEGDLLLTDKNHGKETLLQQCVRENVYDPLNTAVAHFFDSLTLSDIIAGKRLS